MSGKSFSRSIGGSHGSSSVNGTSVNFSQSKSFVVCDKPGTAMKEAAAGRVGAESSASAGPKPPVRPTK